LEQPGLKPPQARLTTGANAPTLAAGYFCQAEEVILMTRLPVEKFPQHVP
jgi:hypothetical protein